MQMCAAWAVRAQPPERTLYLGSYSKCIAPGLRLDYAIGPGDTARHIATAMKVNCWSGNPMSALIVTRFIEDGTLQGVIRQQQAELRTRIQTVRSVLGAHGVRAVGTCPHVWLPLPAPWRASTFVSTLRRHDISVLPSDAFATGQEPSSRAIRINVAAARSHAALESALDTIRRLLHAPDQLPMDAP